MSIIGLFVAAPTFPRYNLHTGMKKDQASLIRFLSLILTTVSVFWGLYMWLGERQVELGVIFTFVLPLVLIAAIFYHKRKHR